MKAVDDQRLADGKAMAEMLRALADRAEKGKFVAISVELVTTQVAPGFEWHSYVNRHVDRLSLHTCLCLHQRELLATIDPPREGIDD